MQLLPKKILNASSQRARQGGFTFVELLIVLGVMIVLATAGAVNIYSYFSRQTLDNEVKQMVGMMRNAQEKSMSQEESSRWGVSFRNEASDRDAYIFFKVDDALFASSSYTSVPGLEVERRTLKSNIVFFSPTSGNNLNIAFTKISGTPNTSTTIQVQLSGDDTSRKTIFISGNGKLDYQ